LFDVVNGSSKFDELVEERKEEVKNLRSAFVYEVVASIERGGSMDGVFC